MREKEEGRRNRKKWKGKKEKVFWEKANTKANDCTECFLSKEYFSLSLSNIFTCIRGKRKRVYVCFHHFIPHSICSRTLSSFLFHPFFFSLLSLTLFLSLLFIILSRRKMFPYHDKRVEKEAEREKTCLSKIMILWQEKLMIKMKTNRSLVVCFLPIPIQTFFLSLFYFSSVSLPKIEKNEMVKKKEKRKSEF